MYALTGNRHNIPVKTVRRVIDEMPVIDNGKVRFYEIPGLRHQTIAAAPAGASTMEVWRQTIAPGADTPVHRHACEEVIVILKGSGRCIVGDVVSDFGPNSTLIIPYDAVHQILNTGSDEMELVATLGMSPVRVRTAQGEPLPLPWDIR